MQIDLAEPEVLGSGAPEVADELVEVSANREVTPLDPLKVIDSGLDKLESMVPANGFDLATKEGEAAAREFCSTCVGLRTSVDDAYEVINRPLLETGRNARALRDSIKGRIALAETPVKQSIVALDERRAAVKEEKKRIEIERVNKLRSRINGFTAAVMACIGKPSSEIRKNLDILAVIEINDETFQEFAGEARTMRDEAVTKLQTMFDTQFSVEQAQIREQQERQEREAALQAQQKQAEEEEKRVRAIKDKIEKIRDLVDQVTDSSAADIYEVYSELIDRHLSVADFAEMLPAAMEARDLTVSRLSRMHGTAVQREVNEREAARLQQEREHQAAESLRLANERAQLEAQRAPVVEALPADTNPPLVEPTVNESAVVSTSIAAAPACVLAPESTELPQQSAGEPVAAAPVVEPVSTGDVFKVFFPQGLTAEFLREIGIKEADRPANRKTGTFWAFDRATFGSALIKHVQSVIDQQG